MVVENILIRVILSPCFIYKQDSQLYIYICFCIVSPAHIIPGVATNFLFTVGLSFIIRYYSSRVIIWFLVKPVGIFV